MLKVYIAGPITRGDQLANIGRAIDVMNELLDLGFAPFCPHAMSYPAHMRKPRTWQDWLDYDKEWLAVCDCVLRLPGESAGADIEVSFADERGMPVFYGIEHLCMARDSGWLISR